MTGTTLGHITKLDVLPIFTRTSRSRSRPVGRLLVGVPPLLRLSLLGPFFTLITSFQRPPCPRGVLLALASSLSPPSNPSNPSTKCPVSNSLIAFARFEPTNRQSISHHQHQLGGAILNSRNKLKVCMRMVHFVLFLAWQTKGLWKFREEIASLFGNQSHYITLSRGFVYKGGGSALHLSHLTTTHPTYLCAPLPPKRHPPPKSRNSTPH